MKKPRKTCKPVEKAQEEIRLIQIAVGMDSATGIGGLCGLDCNGVVWYFHAGDEEWVRMSMKKEKQGDN